MKHSQAISEPPTAQLRVDRRPALFARPVPRACTSRGANRGCPPLAARNNSLAAAAHGALAGYTLWRARRRLRGHGRPAIVDPIRIAEIANSSPAGEGVLLDPGRPEIRHEFLCDGEERLRLQLSCGGELVVIGNAASEQAPPHGSPPGALQEWRTLRFHPAPTAGPPGPPFVQSVCKVTVWPRQQAQVVADARVLGLNYPKVLVSATWAGLSLLSLLESPRILVIGLGSGSVPLWLAHALPHCKVDVVELEPAVIQAAREAMGFESASPDGRVRIIEGDGAAYAAACAADPAGPRYEAVLVDAYDALNRVPAPLAEPGGRFAQALPRLLSPGCSLVAANVPPGFDVRGMLTGYRNSIVASDGVSGPPLSLQVKTTGSYIGMVFRCAPQGLEVGSGASGALQAMLAEEAKKLAPRSDGFCCFDPSERIIACNAHEWTA